VRFRRNAYMQRQLPFNRRASPVRAAVPPHRIAPRAARRGISMSKEGLFEAEGVVVDVYPDGRFRIQLENGHNIIAYTGGKMRKNRIRMLAGDRVTVEMTPYDLDKGRVIFRHKDEKAAAMAGQQRRPFKRFR
jgi:translation initiation factor IF-1